LKEIKFLGHTIS
jgi:hypothetical protein